MLMRWDEERKKRNATKQVRGRKVGTSIGRQLQGTFQVTGYGYYRIPELGTLHVRSVQRGAAPSLLSLKKNTGDRDWVGDGMGKITRKKKEN